MPLNKQRIVAEAVALLDDGGLEAVTLRKLAGRLGVQYPTLYWHFRNKAALIDALAEALLNERLADVAPPGPEQSWQEWLIGVAEQLRQAMLAHRDGARVVAAAQMSATMAALSELAMRTLVERRLPLVQARLTVLVVQRFTIGHVLEEQSPPPDPAALGAFDRDAFAERHPTLTAGVTEYFKNGRTLDDMFRDSIDLIVR